MAQSMSVSVFLDLSPHGLLDEAAAELEDRICQYTAAVCREALRAGTPFRLLPYGEARMELSSDASKELVHFRRFLAGLRFSCPFPFHEIIRMEMEARPSVSLLVVITTELTPMLSEYMAALSMQGHGVSLMVVPKDAGDAVASHRLDRHVEEVRARAS